MSGLFRKLWRRPQLILRLFLKNIIRGNKVMRIIYLILVIIFSLFIVTFSQQNLTTIQLHYNILDHNLLGNLKSVPTYLLIFISILIGVIITGFWGIVERFRLNRTIRRLNKLVRDLRKELHANEAPPIIDEQKISK